MTFEVGPFCRVLACIVTCSPAFLLKLRSVSLQLPWQSFHVNMIVVSWSSHHVILRRWPTTAFLMSSSNFALKFQHDWLQQDPCFSSKSKIGAADAAPGATPAPPFDYARPTRAHHADFFSRRLCLRQIFLKRTLYFFTSLSVDILSGLDRGS